MSMKRLGYTVTVLSALAAGLPATAYAESNVAAAYSPSTGIVGFATADSVDDARQTAMTECQKGGATDCQIPFSGANMCISLARATSGGSFGIGAASNRAGSQEKAVSECAEDGAAGCNIHDTYCAPDNLE